MKKFMKHVLSLFGVIVLSAIMVCAFVTCKDDEPGAPAFPAAKGKLTVNGLSSFNDKYVYVSGSASGSLLTGITDITNYPNDVTYKLAKISGGKAEVPLYKSDASAPPYSMVAYEGNDNVSLINIYILSESTLKASNAITNNLGKKDLMTGKFSNGNMTIDWGTGGGGNGGGDTDGGSSLNIEMVTITGGTFTMGSPTSESGRENNETQHSVTLSGFSMGKYQVTQEQYQAVMGSNPSYFKSAVTGESGTPGKLPVERVSWYDALVFCNKLSMAKGLNPVYSISGSTDPAVWGTVPTSSNSTWNAVVMDKSKNGYRLPTEAEWEYACRAGTTTAFNNGNDDWTNDTLVGAVAWYSSNSGGKTRQVGLKNANNWGLYDMHGNVWEWCWDWNGDYTSSSVSNPTGAVTGSYRVLRGGSWNILGFLRSASRSDNLPYYRYSSLGFRLVRS